MQVGPYVLEGVLGQGGMGTVHRARHILLHTPVALKQLTLQDPAARALFVEEARMLFGRKHASFPTVLDLMEEQGHSWLVMDLIEGPTLSSVLQHALLTASEASGLGVGLCQALSYLHGCGLLHRDIKPDNILLPRGLTQPVLVDLGIAGRVGGGAAVAFTPGMAPPEQVAGGTCVPASDVYQVGATLHCALTGLPPTPGSPPDTTLGPSCVSQPGLMQAIAAALRADVNQRPNSARAMQTLLETAAVTSLAPAPPVPVRRSVMDIRR